MAADIQDLKDDLLNGLLGMSAVDSEKQEVIDGMNEYVDVLASAIHNHVLRFKVQPGQQVINGQTTTEGDIE